MDWHTFFAEMPDYRVNRRKKHHLVDILVIALCALISGADDFEEIEAYGRRKEAFLRTFLDLANGIPSHDTFTRVFRRMDTEAFGRCLYAWSAQVLASPGGASADGALQAVNVDGKVLRGTARAGAPKSGICIVSAWASAHSLVLGQEKVAAKSNEKTAIPDLLRALDLRQTLVSCDAAGCQLSNADLIVEGGGQYVLALKKNLPVAYEQVDEYFSQRLGQLPAVEEVDFGSGRLERRRCTVETRLELLDGLADWGHLRSLVRVDASREINGHTTTQTRYYLSSLVAPPTDFNRYIRQHWHIENRLHWKLDVVFREDRQRTRLDNGPLNLATARKLALQALHQVQDANSTKNRRKMAGWDDEYLRAVLAKMAPV
jgi:predicted transposase YbfD/YdcC